ncbi:leucine-rich repeat domain-containing protein [Microcoleus sp. herbarium14]|uniref:leucine-rich repeat domain-containing protein n=1 Tax=Microcoleus sp. herbarium14 TaxID=3055439 RepID=UPI002FCEF231
MPEPQANQPINFSSFADWCKHKDSLSESARHTVEMLLKKAGTSDCNQAHKVLSNLTKLNLSTNQITDITPLSRLTNLTELHLYNNQISDLTGLSALINLTELELQFNQITDITGLSALTNLTELSLSNNQITDISSLSALTNLTKIGTRGNQISDITSLSALINLTELELQFNQITDITGLSALTNLTELHLENNQITDITGLSALTNLTELHLENNQITDITSLSRLTKLSYIKLYNNQITDLNLPIELTQKYLTLSTKPIDSQRAAEAVKKIYAAIGKEAPQVIVCSSPQLASLELCKLLKIGSISQYQMSEISEIAVTKAVWRKPLLHGFFQWVNVGFYGGTLCNALSNAIILEPNADRTLVSEFQELLKNDLESLGDDFRSCSNYLEPLTPTNLVKEIHVTEFLISKFGVTLDLKARELLHCKQQLFEECGWIFPFEKICLICARPLHIRFDTENRLHAEGESAIAFADGYSLYFHHGVKLPEQYGKVHPDLWQAQWLLSEENAEIRRVLIERIGYDRLCCELQAVELDSWQEYTLLKIDNADVEPIYLLKMTCPSTGFIHALRVPPDVESAKEAIRWVNWDIDPEDFSVQT